MKIFNNIKDRFLKDIYEVEIFNSCITLKNLAIVQKNQPMSADFVYEKLMENSKHMKPIYAEMIKLYRRGDDNEAFQLITKHIKSRNANNFSLILSKLDQINPVELIEQVVAFQDAVSDSRVTRELKKADRNSIITTICSTALIFALLLNFAVVVVFMDTMRLLKDFF